MAIPTWTWSDRSLDRGQGELDPSTLADEFAALTDPTRVAILQTLAREAPLEYTALREAVGVRDKGRFNYHLRQLERYLDRGSGDYRLSSAGERVVEHAIAVADEQENNASPSA